MVSDEPMHVLALMFLLRDELDQVVKAVVVQLGRSVTASVEDQHDFVVLTHDSEMRTLCQEK